MAIVDSELTVVGRLTNASNATLLVTCHDTTGSEESFRAIYKPVAGERALWDFPDGTLAAREYASYLISQSCGFGIVPETVLREGPFGFGMVQRWIEIDDSLEITNFSGEPPAPFLEQTRLMALFDCIINNGDRKFGHILPTSEGRLFGCDHGVTFHVDNHLRTVLWQFAGSAFNPTELGKLHHLLNLNLSTLLSEYLSDAEVAALRERVVRLVDLACFPEPSEDWPPIPWPPF